ncbi:MAG: VWA domain-containing protein [Planctomycetaceae bacterium]|jgi:uncharacterized protein YegL|nr:VWA domain-containing protein [Planctomycetaceae bacterium]
MSNDFRVNVEELISNPSNRVPVVLCLDASGSMFGDPIRELNNGIELFINSVKEDHIAAASVELCIITFSDNAQVVEDFCGLGSVSHTQVMSTGGMTNLGAGVNLALDRLQQRKALYQKTGVEYYQPWLVLMTDGVPTTSEHIAAAEETCRLESTKKLVVFPIGIGSGADMSVLSMFSKKRPPLKLKGLNFRQFFDWLSKSVSRVSQSMPGEHIKIDTSGIAAWGDIQ